MSIVKSHACHWGNTATAVKASVSVTICYWGVFNIGETEICWIL